MRYNQFKICDECSDITQLPVLDANQLCYVRPRYSQIGAIIFFSDGLPLPTDWTDEESFCNALNNTDEQKGKYLAGIGSLAAPEKTKPALARGVEKVTMRKYTIEFEVKNLSDTNEAFLKTLQCGFRGFNFWYQTIGGRIYGNPSGIRPAFVDVDFPLDGGRDDYERAVITIKFCSLTDPQWVDFSLLECVRRKEQPIPQVWGNPETGEVWGGGGGVWGSR